MSELAKLVAPPRTDIIEGVSVPKAKLVDYAMAEEHFERDILARAGQAAVGLPDLVGEKIVAAAMEKVSNGYFRYGRGGFWMQASAISWLSFMIYVLLRNGSKDLTLEMVRGMIPEDDKNRYRIQRGILEQFGYDMSFLDKKDGKSDTKTPPNDQAVTAPTGEPSSSPSGNAA